MRWYPIPLTKLRALHPALREAGERMVENWTYWDELRQQFGRFLMELKPSQFKRTINSMSIGELKLARMSGISGWRWWYVERRLASLILRKLAEEGKIT